MGYFEKLRKSIGNIILNRRLKQIKRNVLFNNFNSATSIGLVFSVGDDEHYKIIKKFINELKKNKAQIYGIGYLDNRDNGLKLPYIEGIEYFSKKNVNWYFKPDNAYINFFSNKPFDVLIDLTLDEKLPLKFITGLSNAKYKIGSGCKKADYYDMTLSINDKKSIQSFISQLNHYMSVLRVPNQVEFAA